MSDQDLQLREGSVLVHIGPPKTGTTAVQASLHVHRAELAEHGVLYPGPAHRFNRPGWALLGKTPPGIPDVPMSEWETAAREIRDSDARLVCISTETFATLSADKVQRLVDELGAERVHMVATVRRLDRLLPSSWQERVKSRREIRTYDDWLREVLFREEGNRAAGSFWRNHGIEGMLRRWTPAIPPEQITLVVADETDRNQLLRTFERLLGLPDQLLKPGPWENTSLSYDRIELYRLVNQTLGEQGVSDSDWRRLMYAGVLPALRRAPAAATDIGIPLLPLWAAEKVAELSEVRAGVVAESGARVVGDPTRLRFVPHEHEDEIGEAPTMLPVESAARAIEGAIDGALRPERGRNAGRPRSKTPPGGASSVDSTSSKDLLREVLRRQRRRFMRAEAPGRTQGRFHADRSRPSHAASRSLSSRKCSTSWARVPASIGGYSAGAGLSRAIGDAVAVRPLLGQLLGLGRVDLEEGEDPPQRRESVPDQVLEEDHVHLVSPVPVDHREDLVEVVPSRQVGVPGAYGVAVRDPLLLALDGLLEGVALLVAVPPLVPVVGVGALDRITQADHDLGVRQRRSHPLHAPPGGTCRRGSRRRDARGAASG